jgi:hypothetical protein
MANMSVGLAIKHLTKKGILLGLEYADGIAECLGLHGWRIKSVVRGIGFDPENSRVLLYAHYNSSYRITALTLGLLKNYRDQGYNVVLATSSRRVAPSDLEAARKICAMIVRRRSYGRDFGAWKDAWRLTRRFISNPKEIILTNDTLLGPLRPLGDLFCQLEATKGDVVGLTDSWDRAYHLQSFFLLFREGPGVASCDRFLRRLFVRNTRRWVITCGEVGLTRYLMRQGLRIGTVIRYEHVLRYVCSDAKMFQEFRFSNPVLLARMAQRTNMIREPKTSSSLLLWELDTLAAATLNGTHHFWHALIDKFGFPFIKADLLTHNPSRIFGLGKWRGVVKEIGHIEPELIERHLMSLDLKRVP